MLDISVIVPLYNEEESLPELCAWIERVMIAHNFSYEDIFVNDGSRDKSWKVIKSISQNNTNIKGISFSRNYGKSAALHVAILQVGIHRDNNVANRFLETHVKSRRFTVISTE